MRQRKKTIGANLADRLSEIEVRIDGSLSFYDSDLHGLGHLREVALLAGEIAAMSGGDIEAAMVAGMLHDCGRMNDSGGNQHAIDSARLGKDVLAMHYPHLDSGSICDAIARHADGEVTDDLLAAALWDADRLTLVRLGRRIDEAMMSTSAGRQMARERNARMKEY